MRKVMTVLHRCMTLHASNSRLSTIDGLAVYGSHLNCDVALHSTHDKFSAPRHIYGALATVSRLVRAALPRETDTGLACIGTQAKGKAHYIQQHTWLARFGSLKPSKVVPLAFAVSRLEVVTSLASLIKGTNSTPEGTVSPCMHDECGLIGQGPLQEHKHFVLRKLAIIAAPLLCIRAIVEHPPEYQERLPSHTPTSHLHLLELWPAH